jgi:phenylpropionate dioxygenase-like ring-hydroxylating dioxygenase large terminal subunit/AcrR family transcriptional regulator
MSANAHPVEIPHREGPRQDERRRQLIEAAIIAISEHGLSGTTVARVAKQAGFSPGVVTFYFKTKDALLLATLQYVDDLSEQLMLEALERAGEDPVRQLTAIVEWNFDPAVCNPPRVAVWNTFWGEARARKDYGRVCGGRKDALLERVVNLFGKIAKRGDYANFNANTLGRAFFHLISSLPEDMLGDEEPFDYDAARATCFDFLAIVFPAEFGAGAPTEELVSDPIPLPEREAKHDFTTLPTWTYDSPEFLELEKEYLFRRQWLIAGHASEMPNPGDYITVDAVGERGVIIRGKDGALRGFHNVCRHRASRVVTGESGNCAGHIVCPYHGWRYDLDGGLRSVPFEKTFSGLNKAEIGLSELEIEEWMGIVFVRFGGDGPSVSDAMQPYEDEIAKYRVGEMKLLGKRWSSTFDANWKLAVENDSEGYHVPVGHPGLRRLFGREYYDEPYRVEGSRSFSVLEDKLSSVWSERMYQKLLPKVEHLPEDQQRAWIYYGLFPTAGIICMPDRIDFHQTLPVTIDQSRYYGFSVALEDDRPAMRAARYLNQRINAQVSEEDDDFCLWTHEGVRSSSYDGGILSDLETGVRDFAEAIRERIPVARCAQAPAQGELARINQAMLENESTP